MIFKGGLARKWPYSTAGSVNPNAQRVVHNTLTQHPQSVLILPVVSNVDPRLVNSFLLRA